MTTTNTTNSFTGKYVFVSGIAGGREVFLGRAIDEPFNDQLTIEGKPITWNSQGQMNLRPFTTRTNFSVNDPNFQIQVITNQEVTTEISTVLNSAINQITRWNYPLTFRWIESAVNSTTYGTSWGTSGTWTNRGFTNQSTWQLQANPFAAYFTGFRTSAEQFRRALFTSPQVTSTTEMDRVTELEGNLAIGFGKITNETAIKFNNIINRENDLTHYFEWVQAFNMPYTATSSMTGWYYLSQRMQIAKGWARRQGKAPLVREINTLFKEAVNTLNEIVLDHCTTLDTVITETCTQYGISFELYGEMSPFAESSMSSGTRADAYSQDSFTGAGTYNTPVGV